MSNIAKALILYSTKHFFRMVFEKKKYENGSIVFVANHSIKFVVDGARLNALFVNAGVTQGCVLSPMLFFLHINIFCKLATFIAVRTIKDTIHFRCVNFS